MNTPNEPIMLAMPPESSDRERKLVEDAVKRSGENVMIVDDIGPSKPHVNVGRKHSMKPGMLASLLMSAAMTYPGTLPNLTSITRFGPPPEPTQSDFDALDAAEAKRKRKAERREEQKRKSLEGIKPPKPETLAYPEKLKAKGCCAPIWECDIDGNKIG